jgi:predicted CXXCH cytochrome family protein
MVLKPLGPLCASCHADLEADAKSAKSKHQPADSSNCTACHNPHKARLQGLLLAKSPDLCVTCHKDLKARMEKEKPHQPAARDCLRCHTPHMSAQESLMAQAIQPMCLECHNPQKGNFATAHLNIDASVMNCRACHDPHASKDPMFFKAGVHAPFASRACEECHIQ